MVNLSLGKEYVALIERLTTMIADRFVQKDAGQLADLEGFVRHFYATAPLHELQRKHLDDLYGMTLGLWSYLRQAGSDDVRIRVFNPKYEECGWQSSHTVVEVLARDRAFLVDTVNMEISRRDISIHNVISTVVTTERNAQGELVKLSFNPEDSGQREALIHLEIDRQVDLSLQQDISDQLKVTLHELDYVVADFKNMEQQSLAVRDRLQTMENQDDEISLHEVKSFLGWLVPHHFTLLAMAEYELDASVEGGPRLQRVAGSELGLAKISDELDLMTPSEGPLVHPEKMIVFGKSATRSRWHRPVYMDFVGVRIADENGKITGEYRWLGLYTSLVYSNSPRNFPIVGHQLRQVIEGSGLEHNGHDGKRLMQIMETFPREELFQSSTEELLKTAVGVLHIQERRRLKLFVRRGIFGRFLSCLIYTPKDTYSTALRQAFQRVLLEYLDVEDMEFKTHFTESTLARLNIVVKVSPESSLDFDFDEVEGRLIELARSWSDRIHETLIENVGEDRAGGLFNRYADAFSLSYREDFSTRSAISDIEHIESLTQDKPLAVSFYRNLEDDPKALRFKLFLLGKDIPLSDVLPMLENLGLRVLGGRPYHIRPKKRDLVCAYDFSVSHQGDRAVELDSVKQKFQDAFINTWYGLAENDSFNRLVLAVNLNWRQVAMLRGYAKYLKQTGFAFSQSYIKEALVNQWQVTRLLVELFERRFNPQFSQSPEQEKQQCQDILEQLDQVSSLDEDRILRRYLDVITGTLRTNYYQAKGNQECKDYIVYKLAPSMIPDLPKPLPKFEIFVYSPRLEGVHLRGGKVARGGLRWSDRKEDFRTEVLGLVKAQQVKNSVIVPVGAKGGFVPKQLPINADRNAIMEEGVACYKVFIEGLLDVTDNLDNGEVVPPKDVVRKDEDDTYLVVAADKGTATFSDIANEIATRRGFWLGDAFASGGSVGYDHKKMGITARGAWVSVQRHFRELGVDVQTQTFTVVGIGDMSGDVFGNGMLLSKAIRLTAAFNHLHIFVDPNPDAEPSFKERERLFALPRSGWNDYDESLISAGGGIFSRAQKSIPISAEMQERFGIEAKSLTPNELIMALLKAEVDLIWNGGIGTYIKSSSESNAEVGDKSNDGLRVNGNQLRAKVIGEGGNLGITQLGRIQFCLNGGRCNTDFIDNAAGVDCSDHEVNIKILLNDIVANGDLTVKQRNQLLFEMTEQVAALVLKHNYRQTQAISVACSESNYRISEYRRYIQELVAAGKLDRELENIPSDEELFDRISAEKGLMRPELSTLLSTTKAILKDELSRSDLPDDDYIKNEIKRAFPKLLVEKYPEQMFNHKLHREIVATQVASSMIDIMGTTFVYRMKDASGSSIANIAKSYIAARDVFDLEACWAEIEALDLIIPADEQMAMMRTLMRLMRRASRWFLRNHRSGFSVQAAIDRFQHGVKSIADSLPAVLKGKRREVWEQKHNRYVEKGVPSALASFIAGADSMLPVLGIIQASEITEQPLREVAEVYFAIGSTLNLYWFSEEINALPIENHWQALAREAYRDDLDWQQRSLAVGVLQMDSQGKSVAERVEDWSKQHEQMIGRWRTLTSELQNSDTKDFSMFSVALRELMDLAQSTLHLKGGELDNQCM